MLRHEFRFWYDDLMKEEREGLGESMGSAFIVDYAEFCSSYCAQLRN